MRPQHPRASGAEILHTRGPSARRARPAAPPSGSSAAAPAPGRASPRQAQAANADPKAAPRRGRGPAPPPGDSRGAEQGRLRARGSAPLRRRLGARPGVLTLRPVAATREPRTEARAPRGWRGLGLGRRGRAVGGCGTAALTRVCAAPRASAAGTDSVSSFPFPQDASSAGFPAPPPSHLPPRTPAHSLLGTWGRGGSGQPQDSCECPYLHFLEYLT